MEHGAPPAGAALAHAGREAQRVVRHERDLRGVGFPQDAREVFDAHVGKARLAEVLGDVLGRLRLCGRPRPARPHGDEVLLEAHDALLAIAGGSVLAQTERRKLNDQYYFKTRAEMVELFADLPEALDSTVEIAKRVAFRPRTRGPILPKFAAGSHATEDEVVAAEAAELRRIAVDGLDKGQDQGDGTVASIRPRH